MAIKRLLKLTGISVGIFFACLIVIIVIIGSIAEKKNNPETSGLFKFEDYIQTDKVREFRIVKEEDASMKALGDKKPSEYSSEELRSLPTNYRMNYSIIVPVDITSDELKSTLAQVIKEKSENNPDIDEIWIQAWESEESVQGNPSIGTAKWVFNGEGGSVTPEIATSNLRNNYSIIYSIREDILENLRSNKTTDNSGLSEELKKEIYAKLADCEGRADREAEKMYGWGCDFCLEFVEYNSEKYAKKTD